VDFALVVPGIMGSCLRYEATNQDLWTEDFDANYHRLVRNSALFTYGERAQPTGILKNIRLFRWLSVKDLYGRLLKFLGGHPDFNHPGGVIEFPYDWRGDLNDTADLLGHSLRERFGPSPDDWPCRITPVTHSMGALVVRIALAKGVVPMSKVRRIVHIAPPLMGSAAAFRSAYHDIRLPLASMMFDWVWRMNSGLARQHLLEVMRTFPSVYQLMPPEHELYLYCGSGGNENPLQAAHSVITPQMKLAAKTAHDAIKASVDVIARSNVPVHTIRGVSLRRATDALYKVFVGNAGYEILEPLPYGHATGDSTVTADSASYGGQDATPDVRDVLNVEHAEMCNAQTVVENLRTILV
jgi:hypothetical protein